MAEKSSKTTNPSKVTKKTKCTTNAPKLTPSSNNTSTKKITSLGDYYYSSDDDGMDEEREDFHLVTTRTRVGLEQLLCVDNELYAMNEKCQEEILNIEMKYHEKTKALVNRRDGKIATIPGFWYKVMTYHPVMGTLINEEEEDCLRYLTRIEVEPLRNIKKDFRIKFHFDINPFFKNKLLVKELLISQGYSRSSNIHWKNNSNLIQLHQQNIKKAEKRGYHVSRNSLFSWFKNTTLPPAEDYFAKVIKNDLLRNPLDLFFLDDDGQSYDSMDEEDLSQCIVVK